MSKLVIRMGHLMHSPTELEGFADVLERSSFTNRESLRELSDSCADALGIPRKLARALRTETMESKLQRRYSGPLKPVEEIAPNEELVRTAKPPKSAGDHTPITNYKSDSKVNRSHVLKQVMRIGNRLHPPWELERIGRRLEENGFTTRDSLIRLNDDVARRLRVPVVFAKALREAEEERVLASSPSSPQLRRGSPRGRHSDSLLTPASSRSTGAVSNVPDQYGSDGRLVTVAHSGYVVSPYTPPAATPRPILGIAPVVQSTSLRPTTRLLVPKNMQ